MGSATWCPDQSVFINSWRHVLEWSDTSSKMLCFLEGHAAVSVKTLDVSKFALARLARDCFTVWVFGWMMLTAVLAMTNCSVHICCDCRCSLANFTAPVLTECRRQAPEKEESLDFTSPTFLFPLSFFMDDLERKKRSQNRVNGGSEDVSEPE